MATFKHIKTPDPFLANNTGVRIAPQAWCEHGQTAVLLVLFGQHQSQRGPKRLDTLLPRCVLAEAIGQAQAQILREEGETALQEFLDTVAESTNSALDDLEQLHAQHRDCCEAGFRTNGAEHTCSNSTEAGR